MSFVDDGKVDLFAVDIGSCDLNGYFVAKSIASVGVTTNDTVIFFVKLVVVVG